PTPRPLRSTLFPYTTLFRSRPREQRAHDRVAAQARRRPSQPHVHLRAPRGGSRHAAAPPPVRLELRRRRPGLGGLRQGLGERARDRKSTRLNSSHVKTSYAV